MFQNVLHLLNVSSLMFQNMPHTMMFHLMFQNVPHIYDETPEEEEDEDFVPSTYGKQDTQKDSSAISWDDVS